MPNIIRNTKTLPCAVLASAALLIAAGCSEHPSPPAAEVVNTSSDYPLDVCVVSGEKLGSMGDPYEVVVEGKTVKLCCAGCEDQLRGDPATYLAKLDAASSSDVSTHTPHAGHGDHDHAH